MIVEQRGERFSGGDVLPANRDGHAVKRRRRQSRVEQDVKSRLASNFSNGIGERNVLHFNQRDDLVPRRRRCRCGSVDKGCYGYDSAINPDRFTFHGMNWLRAMPASAPV